MRMQSWRRQARPEMSCVGCKPSVKISIASGKPWRTKKSSRPQADTPSLVPSHFSDGLPRGICIRLPKAAFTILRIFRNSLHAPTPKSLDAWENLEFSVHLDERVITQGRLKKNCFFLVNLPGPSGGEHYWREILRPLA